MTDRLIIHGGNALKGEVPISGAKNAALKILAAGLLSSESISVSNLPHLVDVTIMLELLSNLGCDITVKPNMTVDINSSTVTNVTVPYALVKAMRASVVVLGPLLARFHEAKVALPGGCAIGPRPIDVHLKGLKAMGADIVLKEGFVNARSSGRLKGADIDMDLVTVTGTENLMMAATLAEGVTTLHNAAQEPEVVDLANFLIKMGAKIKGAGTPIIQIEGVEKLGGTEHHVIPDRIEAGTYLLAGAMTGGCVTATGVDIPTMSVILQKIREAGARVIEGDDFVTVDMHDRMLRAVDVETAPYPGFPTDMQAQVMAMNAIASGVGMIKETIFENRLMQVAELQRLGAQIRVKGNTAISAGVHELTGAPVMSSDLRASACLILAGLVAIGETIVEGVYHLDRGYAHLEEKFSRLGADIHRVVH